MGPSLASIESSVLHLHVPRLKISPDWGDDVGEYHASGVGSKSPVNPAKRDKTKQPDGRTVQRRGIGSREVSD